MFHALAKERYSGMKNVSLLASEAQCREVVLQAADAVDSADWQRFAALFLPAGILVRPDGSELCGRSAIVQAYQARDPDRLTEHLICNHRVEVDESAGTATSRCKVLLWSSKHSAELTPKGRLADATAQVGEMVDSLQHTPEGWRISSRRARFTLYRS